MKKSEIADIKVKIENYIGRRDTGCFDLEEEGMWELTSGTMDDRGRRSDLGVYEGRYIDAVVKLVSSGSYGGWWCTDPKSDGHGKIRRFKIKKMRQLKLSNDFMKERKEAIKNKIKKLQKELA